MSCYAASEPLDPVCEKTMTEDLDSFVGQSGRAEVSGGPDEANSDSGDSLFITQKSVPEAVRSRTRRRHQRSNSTTQEDPAAEHEDDLSNSTSDEEPEKKTRRKRVYTVPKYRFSFLTEKKKRPTINSAKNKKLHVYAMGCYIKSVEELWGSFEHGQDLKASLPTVDVDGESISPISEEEEETMEEEDIKVVERKHFVISLKAKCSQPWCSLKAAYGDKRPSNALNESQAEGRRKTIYKVSKMKPLCKEMLSSATETSEDEGSLCRDVEKVKSSSTQSCDGSVLEQTETPKTMREIQKGNKIWLDDDSDTTVCEPSPEKRIQIDREAAVAATEPNREVSDMEERSQSGDTECGHENQMKKEMKKRKKTKYKGDCESVEEGKEQIYDKTGCQREVIPPVIITEEETPSLLEDINAPDSKRTEKSAEITQEQSSEQVEEDSVGHSAMETVIKKKKKKKKRCKVDTESTKTTEAAEPPTDEGNRPKKKKKDLDGTSDLPQTSTEHQEEIEEYSENTEASQETMGSSFKKGKKHKNNKKESASDDNSQTGQDCCIDENICSDAVTVETNTDLKVKKKKKKKKESASDDNSQTGQDGCIDENICSDAVTVETNTDLKVKKKKKKKESASDDNSQTGQDGCIDENVCSDAVTVETNTDFKVKKKKKKGSTSETVITQTAEEDEKTDGAQKAKHDSRRTSCGHTVAPDDHSVSVQKKKKKRTSPFRAADGEEKGSKTHEGQADHLQSAASPDVSVGASAATSANVMESLQKTNSGVKKKKRKRITEQQCVERELESEEPKETSETGVKKKLKRKKNNTEAESLADVEVSQTDEDVPLKKRKKKEKQKVPPAATEEAEFERPKCVTSNSVSPKEKKLATSKSKYVHNTETPHNRRLSDNQETRETLAERVSPSSGQPGNQALGGVKEKQTKKKRETGLQEVESSTETSDLKAHKSKQKKRTKPVTDSSFNSTTGETFLSRPETSPSHRVRQKKTKGVKRRLYNPNEDVFLLS